MRSDIYLHSLHADTVNYSGIKTRELLEKILKSREVLSARLSGEVCHYNFSGIDYISLCDYERRHCGKGFKNTYNGFYQYVVYDPSLMFPKNEFEVIEPIILDKMVVFYSNYRSMMRELGLEEERYTDLEDEVQVRDRISLDKLCGLTMPSREFVTLFGRVEANASKLYDEVRRYKELLIKYGYDVPIYDINTTKQIDSYDDACEVILSLKKKQNK